MSFIFRKLYQLFEKVLIMQIRRSPLSFLLSHCSEEGQHLSGPLTLCIVVANAALNFILMRQASWFNTREQSFLENVEVFLATAEDPERVDAWFRDDLLCRGVYKSIALKRYKHTTGATEQWEWEVVERKPNKTVSSSNFWSSCRLSIDFCGCLCNFVFNLYRFDAVQ